MSTSEPSGVYQLPGYVVLLIGLAMLVMWLSLLIIVIGMIVSGADVDLGNIIPQHVDDAMRVALIFQYAVIFLNLLILFVFGHVICICWLASAHAIAVVSMIWLIRVMLALMFVQLLASNAVPASIGGVFAALPGLVSQLPLILVSAAILVFAERTLVHRHTQG